MVVGWGMAKECKICKKTKQDTTFEKKAGKSKRKDICVRCAEAMKSRHAPPP
jgi:hypothetical protein